MNFQRITIKIILLILIVLRTSFVYSYDWLGIVVHHSASDFGTVKDIERWHKERGWDGIGYHYVIYRNGAIHKGRDINKIGAHAKTGKSYSRNKTHIGIVLIGNGTYTKAQEKSLYRLSRELVKKYPIKSIERHWSNEPTEELDIEKLEKEIIR